MNCKFMDQYRDWKRLLSVSQAVQARECKQTWLQRLQTIPRNGWPVAGSVGRAAGFHEDKVDVVIAPTALHLGHVKAPLEALGMQVRWSMMWLEATRRDSRQTSSNHQTLNLERFCTEISGLGATCQPHLSVCRMYPARCQLRMLARTTWARSPVNGPPGAKDCLKRIRIARAFSSFYTIFLFYFFKYFKMYKHVLHTSFFSFFASIYFSVFVFWLQSRTSSSKLVLHTVPYQYFLQHWFSFWKGQPPLDLHHPLGRLRTCKTWRWVTPWLATLSVAANTARRMRTAGLLVTQVGDAVRFWVFLPAFFLRLEFQTALYWNEEFADVPSIFFHVFSIRRFWSFQHYVVTKSRWFEQHDPSPKCLK